MTLDTGSCNIRQKKNIVKKFHIKLQVDSLAVNLHDAVVLYALGLNKSITEGTEDCKVVKQDISNVTFEGSSSFLLIFFLDTDYPL